MAIQQQVKSSFSHLKFFFNSFFIAEKTLKKAISNITIEDQRNRRQGLSNDNNLIGPSIPKPIYSSTAKTIKKPPQLSPLAKPLVTIAASQQRTIVATPIIPRVGIQPVATVHLPPPMEESSSKRLKTEDQPIPEEDFYKTYGKVR
jgi:hypothetical protein